MILINLLPPELRRRQPSGGGFNAVPLVLAAGLLINLGALGFWGWLNYRVLPEARKELASRKAELERLKVEAGKVQALKAQIQQFRERRDVFVSLLARKVYHARLLDDFANLLNKRNGIPKLDGSWGMPLAAGGWTSVDDFDVRGLDLSMQEIGAPKGKAAATTKSKQETLLYSFRWRYKLIGKQNERSGDYLRAFFKTVEKSAFWRDHGFVDKPDKGYFGDYPRWSQEVERVIIEGNLDWQRAKIVDIELKRGKPDAKPATAQQGK